MILSNLETRNVLMLGMSHYVDIGAPKEAVMLYLADGIAHIRLPDGTTMLGSWQMNDKGYSVAWEGGPRGDWHFDYEPGRICYVDGEGKRHGPITRIVPGDPERLAG